MKTKHEEKLEWHKPACDFSPNKSNEPKEKTMNTL